MTHKKYFNFGTRNIKKGTERKKYTEIHDITTGRLLVLRERGHLIAYTSGFLPGKYEYGENS